MAAQISTKIRLVFLIWNVLYFITGLVMFSVGVATIVQLKDYDLVTQDYYNGGAGIFIAVGILKMVFAVLGFIALFGKWKWLLVVYTIALIALMLFTFIAAIYGFLRRPDVYDKTNQRLRSAYEDCANNEDDLQSIQDEFDCCGVNAKGVPADVQNCPLPFAENCRSNRNTTALTTYRLGCLVYVTDKIQDYLYNIGAIGMAFGTWELTSFLVAMQNLEGL